MSALALQVGQGASVAYLCLRPGVRARQIGNHAHFLEVASNIADVDQGAFLAEDGAKQKQDARILGIIVKKLQVRC